MMTQLTNYGYGGFLVLKKEKDEPFKEALQLWEIEGRCESCDDAERKEQVDFWDVDNIETLDTYQGRVRAVRAVVTKPDQEKPTTWCFAIIGQRARQISRQTALRIIRSRWHIEDTGFHQWISYWHLGHVFRHGENPLQVILLIWTLAFNLLQLFIYRRWVAAADRRILPIPSGTSSRSCCARWPFFLSLFLGRLSCSTLADAPPAPR